MTRAIIYSATLALFIAASALTLTSLLLPQWLSFSNPSPLDPEHPITRHDGLHTTCDSNGCRPYPQPADCSGPDDYFCSLWRTTGFLMNLAAVLELVTVVAFGIVLLGGREKRRTGWPVVLGLVGGTAVVQGVAMSIVAYVKDHHGIYQVPGWRLDTSWILCTISWIVMGLAGVFFALSAVMFRTEDGYEVIPSERYG